MIELSINGKIYEEHPKVDGCLGCSLCTGTYFICEFIEVHCTSEEREDGKDVILKIKDYGNNDK